MSESGYCALPTFNALSLFSPSFSMSGALVVVDIRFSGRSHSQ